MGLRILKPHCNWSCFLSLLNLVKCATQVLALVIGGAMAWHTASVWLVFLLLPQPRSSRKIGPGVVRKRTVDMHRSLWIAYLIYRGNEVAVLSTHARIFIADAIGTHPGSGKSTQLLGFRAWIPYIPFLPLRRVGSVSAPDQQPRTVRRRILPATIDCVVVQRFNPFQRLLA